MLKAILDTNILISAIGWEGKPRQILDKCLENKFKLVISPEILEEIRDVLFRKKFNFIDDNKKNEFILLLAELADVKTATHKVDICRDKDDNKFIELALSAKAKYVVSGDDDLLFIKKFKGIKIISASEFLRIIED